MADPLSLSTGSSSVSSFISPQRLTELKETKGEDSEKAGEESALAEVEQMTPARAAEVQGYCNKAQGDIEKIRNPEGLPDLDKMAQAAKARKGNEADEAKKTKEEDEKKKKELDIHIEVHFHGYVKPGDVVTPGRTIAHFDVEITGEDANKVGVDKEAIKKSAMRLVEKNSGKSMGLPEDGNLRADSNMKIQYITGNGKLEGGQRVLAVQGLDGKKPFESYMEEGSGGELEKARQYLNDNPDAPDADEVKSRIEKLEKERASGFSDFSTAEQQGDDEKDKDKKEKKS